jgi:arsenate reductase
MTPRQLLRGKEAKEAGIDAGKLDDAALVRAMVANPAVIERPIVVKDGKAALGRPPEAVASIL